MRKIAHISDLHFGTEKPDLVKSIITQFNSLQPDIVIVSGDLTQRARIRQYKKAKKFLEKIKSPLLIVPGNHDIPFYDVFSRFLFPLTRYREYITPNLSPLFLDEEVAIMGVNTARSLTWKNGRISIEQIEEIEDKICPIKNEHFKIIVTHHPFIPPPGDVGIELVGRSAKALKVIDQCGVDLLLAGHLHQGYSGDIRPFYPAHNRSVISAQAGTVFSKRVRNEANAYNFITVEDLKINIEIRAWNGMSFESSISTCYKKIENEWRREK